MADLLITLDPDSREPLHSQIEKTIRAHIRSGRLRKGSPLPPTRNLAATLGVSRGVVVEAYEQLTAEGYLSARTGGYTEVAIDPHPPVNTAARQQEPARPMIDFRYGRADPAQFPRTAWLRSINRAVPAAPTERFNYLDGHGVVELRTALADYLNRVRGTAAHPDRIVITNGYAQAIALLVHTMAGSSNARRLAIEDPSPSDDAFPLAIAAGLDVKGIPVDDQGIRVAELTTVDADAVVVTPSHQWPTGAVLAPERRAELLRWARERNALIIEDDYDAEYRYDRAPIGAMQGLDPDHVVYAGTASKTLAPGLRLGWLVLPADLVERVAAAKIAADRGSPVIDQLAFADFLTHGEFDRYLRRMRPIYRSRRDALLDALSRHLPDLEPTGISAGFHLVTWLPPGLSEDDVVAAAARRDVGVYGLAPYRIAPGRAGLLFGYAGLTEQTIEDGIARLAQAITEQRHG
ncbi:MAG TPA: PLP-dependent aminotransferase family protein [Pseudonocardiaceae bacterium]|nr:PLP-dependent aminotransferase family protein [Pseudonocardiaceae bacterium]